MENTSVHYVCVGTCGGVSDHPQNCEAENCNFFNEPLHPCSCEDGMHRQDIPVDSVPDAV